MKATMTENQRTLVSAVRAGLGSRVDHLSDEQLSLNMGRSRKVDSAIAAIEEWLASTTEATTQEDVQEDDQELEQEAGATSEPEQEGAQESEQEAKGGKKKAKKADKVVDTRLRNTYCSVCSADLDITVDPEGHWHLSCRNEHEAAARTIPVTTAARMLLGYTWTQYKEAFNQDTSTRTARRVALAALEGMSEDEIHESLAS